MQIAEPFSLVIFGATGDLTHRKLIPALYQLHRHRLLPDDFEVIGFARRKYDDDAFRASLAESLKKYQPSEYDSVHWRSFSERIFYHQSPFEDPAGFSSLRERISPGGSRRNAIFYLAVQPHSLEEVIGQLKVSGLSGEGTDGRPWSRLVVEKPFGSDLESSRRLNRLMAGVFDESRIFRIDHYLGKEAVQNLLVLRFANSIFEPLWNRDFISYVQISADEKMGVEGRGRYYEQAGALRDMVQNHMMHLLCLTAMEPPRALDADSVRDEKVNVLHALEPISPECAMNGVVRAQYSAGVVDGRQVAGYREEAGVAPDSNTETFVAFRASIKNDRWAGVPFILRTGKRLVDRLTEIDVVFKRQPHGLFSGVYPNVLSIRVQPDEGISLSFQVKQPGPSLKIVTSQMSFHYIAPGRERRLPEAYERLLLDAASGEQTLFARADEVEAAWAYIDPIIQGCMINGKELSTYVAGTHGPAEAGSLIPQNHVVAVAI